MNKIISEYGSEFDWDSNNEYIYDNKYKKQNEEKNLQYFRSGRDALCSIALKYKDSHKKVLMPALCCESMVAPFRKYNYQVEYYKLKEDISYNVNDILSKINQDTVFVYMNYFGIQSLKNTELSNLKMLYMNAIFIEDRTHDILSHRNTDEVFFKPDYTVCSIRKWLAIPDGGLLFNNIDDEKINTSTDEYFCKIRKDALKQKSKYIKNLNYIDKKEYREKLQEANNYIDKNIGLFNISSESIQILSKIDFKKIKIQRKNNVNILIKKLSNSKKIKTLYNDSDNGNLYYPILVNYRDDVQKALSKKNIYCPVIWPIPSDALGICYISEKISNSIIALPCDQRYQEKDMVYICEILKELLEEIN